LNRHLTRTGKPVVGLDKGNCNNQSPSRIYASLPFRVFFVLRITICAVGVGGIFYNATSLTEHNLIIRSSQNDSTIGTSPPFSDVPVGNISSVNNFNNITYLEFSVDNVEHLNNSHHSFESSTSHDDTSNTKNPVSSSFCDSNCLTKYQTLFIEYFPTGFGLLLIILVLVFVFKRLMALDFVYCFNHVRQCYALAWRRSSHWDYDGNKWIQEKSTFHVIKVFMHDWFYLKQWNDKFDSWEFTAPPPLRFYVPPVEPPALMNPEPEKKDDGLDERRRADEVIDRIVAESDRLVRAKKYNQSFHPQPSISYMQDYPHLSNLRLDAQGFLLEDVHHQYVRLTDFCDCVGQVCIPPGFKFETRKTVYPMKCLCVPPIRRQVVEQNYSIYSTYTDNQYYNNQIISGNDQIYGYNQHHQNNAYAEVFNTNTINFGSHLSSPPFPSTALVSPVEPCRQDETHSYQHNSTFNTDISYNNQTQDVNPFYNAEVSSNQCSVNTPGVNLTASAQLPSTTPVVSNSQVFQSNLGLTRKITSNYDAAYDLDPDQTLPPFPKVAYRNAAGQQRGSLRWGVFKCHADIQEQPARFDSM
ncbi:hypothetical protein HDU76_007590, partial [Blyttiomyces sp. JEL0837]